MDFRTAVVYPLFAVLDERVGEASRLDLFEHGIGIRLDGKGTDLDAVIFLRSGRCCGCFHCRKPSLDRCTEGIHILAVFREPVHHIAVVGRDAERVSLAVADDVILGEVVLLTEVDAELDSFLVNGRKIRGIGQTVLAVE